ncbi:hypothetical protein FOXYS1_4645, partial [Fusarium oxysporum]
MEATMQTVPSLVGTGTAIAAAASGLVFGQPTTEPNSFSHPTRRPSHSRRVSIDREPSKQSQSPGDFASTRPATSNTAASALGASHYHTLPRPTTASRPPLSRYQRPPMPQTQSTPPPLALSRNSSFVRQTDSPTIIPESRDSISSNGSWIRRLSIRPLSRHESTRSSIGPDAPSIFSHGSAAPILRNPTTATLPPNKLVKRSTSTRIDPDPLPRRRAKSHLQILPVLRRPLMARS